MAIITVVVPLLASASPPTVTYSKQPIRLSDYRFEFAVFPDSVIPYQMLWFKVAVTNASGRRVPSPNLISGDMVYAISYVDEKGMPMSIAFWHSSGGGAVSVGTLEPGESDVHFVGLGSEVWNPLRPLDSSRVGRTIRLVVTLNPRAFVDEPGRDSALAPRFLPFTTVRAEGAEAAATSLFLRAFAMPARKDSPSPVPFWRELIARYPDSRLVEGALGELHYVADRGLIPDQIPAKAVLSVIRETIERRPESPLLAMMISKLGRGPGFTTAEYDSLMGEIAARRPDSPALEALKEKR
jgi:hypothetical protein